jgi:hypothetical protein
MEDFFYLLNIGMITNILGISVSVLIIVLVVVIIYYTTIKKCPVHDCPERNCPECKGPSYYKLTMYDKITDLYSLDDMYQLSLTKDALEFKKNDVMTRTINTIWKSPTLVDPKYMTANIKGQLCVKNSKDEEIYVYPDQPLLTTGYKEFYIYINNDGNIIFQRYLTAKDILHSGF